MHKLRFKHRSKNILIVSTFTILFAGTIQAAVGKKEEQPGVRVQVLITDKKKIAAAGPTKQPLTKTVYLNNLKYSDIQLSRFLTHSPKPSLTDPTMASQVLLGMNGVPVLDQGQHGTCVTFANTGAIDALLGQGDYISQLCNLELGNYLARYGTYPSGWNGSDGDLVLSELIQFGIVTNATQNTYSCAGVFAYPGDDANNTGNSMTLKEHAAKAVDISGSITWEQVLSDEQRLNESPNYTYDGLAVLNDIKQGLNAASAQGYPNGLRYTFGILLPDACSAGACATFAAANDTWAITPEVQNSTSILGGHELIITGYDDNAVAVDSAGNQYTGLLTIRNSWGSDTGNQGDFYITYDFFQKYVTEIQKIYVNPTTSSSSR